FFPKTPRDAMPVRGARTGLHEMGLPYVSDPSITRHLAEFLSRHAAEAGHAEVNAILFNGGVFQPAALRDHLLSVLHGWYGAARRRWRPLVMTTPSLDLAVALGAAYFAWLKHTGGRRIGGGIARSYYLAVEVGEQPAQKAEAAQGLTVLCVVPQHLEEGHEIVLEKPELELALGEPVTFPLYTSTVRDDDKAGDLLKVAPDQLLRLPALHTILRGGKRAGTKRVPVTLAARSTAIGTLELFCVAKEGGNRWRLEFNIRELVKDTAPREPDEEGRAITDVWLETQVEEAARLIRAAYGKGAPGEAEVAPRELTKSLEAALEAARHEWPTGLCRRLWEYLEEVADNRARSPAHLGRWFNLVGYCLRPGFGDALDSYRIEQLWKLMVAPPRVEGSRQIRSKVPEGGADNWIMWRRVVGGLNAARQQALFDRLRPTLMPGKGKAAVRPQANELAEMWRAAASLERLDAKHKEAMGHALVKALKRS